MSERYKLILGEKQMEAVITALGTLYASDETHLDNLSNQTADEFTATDITRTKEEMKRVEELRIKLVRMLTKEGN